MSNNYNPTKWIGGKTIGTADVMNNMEEGILNAHQKLDELDSQIIEIETRIDNIGGSSGGNVDLSGYVTKELGNANQITFSDGQTFQDKLNNGELRGSQGIQGEQGQKGEKGFDGITPSISIGTVTTLNPNQPATVTRRGTDTNPIFDFGIPKGEKGSSYSETLTTINVSDTLLKLTTDKYQMTDMKDHTQIELPSVSDYTEIHLFFNTTSDLTLLLPDIKYQNTPSISANKSYEFIFTYVNEWLCGVIEYE